MSVNHIGVGDAEVGEQVLTLCGETKTVLPEPDGPYCITCVRLLIEEHAALLDALEPIATIKQCGICSGFGHTSDEHLGVIERIKVTPTGQAYVHTDDEQEGKA